MTANVYTICNGNPKKEGINYAKICQLYKSVTHLCTGALLISVTSVICSIEERPTKEVELKNLRMNRWVLINCICIRVEEKVLLPLLSFIAVLFSLTMCICLIYNLINSIYVSFCFL